jgi:cytochrome P450
MTTFTIGRAADALPLIGHAHQLWLRPLEFVRQLRTCGDIAVIRVGKSNAYVVNHPHLIRQMLVKDVDRFDKGIQFDKMVPFTGNGLFNSRGVFHLRQRRLMQPAFHRSRIAEYVPMMQDISQARIGSWSHGSQVDVNDEMQSLALTIVTKALCSTDIGDRAVREFGRSLPIVLDGIGKRVLDPTGLLEKMPLPANIRFNRSLASMHTVIDDIIRSYRSHGIDHHDLLSRMLLAHDRETDESMTDKQVHDEVISILAAGAETTADTLTWACYLIGERPDVQERMRDEVDTVAGDRPLGPEDIVKLEYTRRVITETLRVFPTTWILTRRPREDTELGGHTIPGGAMVLFSLYALHRDPMYFAEPEVFDPDRWVPAKAKHIPREAYLPFGTGVRGCIGEPFAWAESIVIMATLMRNWRIRPTEGTCIKPLAKALLVPSYLSMITERRVTRDAALR